MLVPVRTIPGVILADDTDLLGASPRNGAGKGALRSEGTTLRWRAPGSTHFGPGAVKAADGYVLLEDGEDAGRFLRARVAASYLQTAPAEREIYLQEKWNGDFTNVNAALALAGTTGDWLFILWNVCTAALSNIRAWIDPAVSYLSISLAAGGPFTTPTDEGSALDGGSLGADQTKDLWVRRTIPPATVYQPKVPAILHFRFDGADG